MKRMNYTAANIGIREFDAGIDDLASAIDGSSEQTPLIFDSRFLIFDFPIQRLASQFSARIST